MASSSLGGAERWSKWNLEGRGVTFAIRVGAELVAHGFEGAGGQQAVAGRIELGPAGHFADFQARDGHHLGRRIDFVAFHFQVLNRETGHARRGRLLPR